MNENHYSINKRGATLRPKNIISSASNAQVKNLSLLQRKSKARMEQGVFVIEGIKMFEEAVDEKILVKAYASESFYQQKSQENVNYFQNIDVEIITDTIFKEISETKTPQGIMGIVKQPEYSLEEILHNPSALLLVIEDVRDPGNLGTMLRTAEGAGITGVIYNASTVDIFNPKVIRATMGSLYRVPFCQVEDFEKSLKKIKECGITLFAAHLQGMDYDTEGSFQKKCAFMIGNEAKGLSEEASAMADALIKIPMQGQVESLNAAVASAILMYEAFRQRRRR